MEKCRVLRLDFRNTLGLTESMSIYTALLVKLKLAHRPIYFSTPVVNLRVNNYKCYT